MQGGPYFSDSVIIDKDVKDKIKELIPLAPLHNPAHIIGIKAFQKALPNVPQVVVFDTVFHQTMPEEAYIFGIPYEAYEDFKISRYGFHGTSHRYVCGRVSEILGKPTDKEDARRMLTMLCGCGSAVHTGISIGYKGKFATAVETAYVTFDDMSAEEIEDYIWLRYNEALDRLKFDNDKDILISVREYMLENGIN